MFLDLNPNGSEYFRNRKKYKNKQPKLESNIFKSNNEIMEKEKVNPNLKPKKSVPAVNKNLSKTKNEPEKKIKVPKQLINKSRINLLDVNRQFNIIFRKIYNYIHLFRNNS